MSSQEWTVARPSKACTDIRIPFSRSKDFEFWVLLTTDRHWDNPHSDWLMQKRHLEQAAELNAPIVDNGDFLCAMQGKYDRRSDKSCLRPEHQSGEYLDTLIKTAADFFEPYAKQFVVIGDGNHETAIRKAHETDLIERLVGTLNTRTGSTIHHHGYGSWVRFLFASGNARHVIKMKRYHGSGGGGPVTKGVIQTNRRAAVIDADIIFSGHVHEEWVLTTVRECLTGSGQVRHRRQLHICGPTYKDEYGDGTHGWHNETGKPPKPIGATWLRFGYNRPTEQIVIDTLRAH